MFGTYLESDVTVLLKDITGLVKPLPAKEREPLIQSGVHYCEMLPLEYEPTPEYIAIYKRTLAMNCEVTAKAVETVSEKIWRDKGKKAVLVSLARAGTPIGILIKRYLRKKYGARLPHYTISIIRGKGIDKNAMNYILRRHPPEGIQFIDGWTGKGAIQRELSRAVKDFPGVSGGLAVLSDPAYISGKCGTHEDILIASSCLNSTVSGLLSRTFLRPDIIGKDDFHGAAFYKELSDNDRTYEFIDTIERSMTLDGVDLCEETPHRSGMDEVMEISGRFGISDINLIKPGIGEATRVLLRRVPWKLLVHSLSDDLNLGHLYRLAKEKNVEITEYPLKNYKACGLIKSMPDS